MRDSVGELEQKNPALSLLVLKKEQKKYLVNYLFTLDYIIRKCYTENVSIVDEKYMFLLYFYKVQSVER